MLCLHGNDRTIEQIFIHKNNKFVLVDRTWYMRMRDFYSALTVFFYGGIKCRVSMIVDINQTKARVPMQLKVIIWSWKQTRFMHIKSRKTRHILNIFPPNLNIEKAT